MIDNDIVNEWLANGISSLPLLLHGTSVDAIILLIENGVLPASDSGDFYFTPVSRNFENSPYLISLEGGRYSKKEAISTSRFYAKENAMAAYLKSELGFTPEWLWDMARWTKMQFFYFLKDDGSVNSYSEKELLRISNEVVQRKGVIIEPNTQIFTLPYNPGDDKNTIAFHSPDGLPSSCIQGLSILGEVEKRILSEYIK